MIESFPKDFPKTLWPKFGSVLKSDKLSLRYVPFQNILEKRNQELKQKMLGRCQRKRKRISLWLLVSSFHN